MHCGSPCYCDYIDSCDVGDSAENEISNMYKNPFNPVIRVLKILAERKPGYPNQLLYT